MNVKERIKKFIDHERLSISAFEKTIEVSNGYVNSISKNIGIDKLNVIVEKYPQLSLEWLITGKGEMLKPTLPTTKTNKLLMPKVVVVDDKDNERIPLVPIRAQAGYLAGYDDVTFIESLPTYSLPNMTNGTYRMFQVKGLSMYPTLQDSSYVVGCFVDDWLALSSNRVCVVVTQNDGIIVKRITNTLEKYGTLYCRSDNRDFPHLSVAAEDIKEIWECKMHLSFEFLDPVTNYQKIASLEADVAHLKEEVQQLRTIDIQGKASE